MKYFLATRCFTTKIIQADDTAVNQMRRDLFLLGWKTTEINKPPHRTTLARWKKCGKMKAIDGCEVEGWRSCQHGKWSWERVMKMVKQ